MSRIDAVEPHNLDVRRLSDGRIQMYLKWHRFKNGKALPPGFTGVANIESGTTEKDEQVNRLLARIWERWEIVARPLIEAWEQSLWEELEISDVRLKALTVIRYNPPDDQIGINLEYDRLDLAGQVIPYWSGVLLYEYRDRGTAGHRMDINGSKRVERDLEKQRQVRESARQVIDEVVQVIKRWEGIHE